MTKQAKDDTTETEDRIHDLELRVSYLEDEMDASYAEHKFVTNAKRALRPRGSGVEEVQVDRDGFGVQVSALIPPDALRDVTVRLNDIDAGDWYAVEAHADGVVIVVEEGVQYD